MWALRKRSPGFQWLLWWVSHRTGGARDPITMETPGTGSLSRPLAVADRCRQHRGLGKDAMGVLKEQGMSGEQGSADTQPRGVGSGPSQPWGERTGPSWWRNTQGQARVVTPSGWLRPFSGSQKCSAASEDLEMDFADGPWWPSTHLVFLHSAEASQVPGTLPASSGGCPCPCFGWTNRK